MMAYTQLSHIDGYSAPKDKKKSTRFDFLNARSVILIDIEISILAEAT